MTPAREPSWRSGGLLSGLTFLPAQVRRVQRGAQREGLHQPIYAPGRRTGAPCHTGRPSAQGHLVMCAHTHLALRAFLVLKCWKRRCTCASWLDALEGAARPGVSRRPTSTSTGMTCGTGSCLCSTAAWLWPPIACPRGRAPARRPTCGDTAAGRTRLRHRTATAPPSTATASSSSVPAAWRRARTPTRCAPAPSPQPCKQRADHACTLGIYRPPTAPPTHGWLSRVAALLPQGRAGCHRAP